MGPIDQADPAGSLVTADALSADGSHLAVIGCKTVVWDLAKLASRVLFEDANCHDQNFQRAAFSSDGQYLAVGGVTVGRDSEKKSAPPGIRLFHVAGPNSETILPLDLGYSSDDMLSALEFSADGRFLASISGYRSSGIDRLGSAERPTEEITDIEVVRRYQRALSRCG